MGKGGRGGRGGYGGGRGGRREGRMCGRERRKKGGEDMGKGGRKGRWKIWGRERGEGGEREDVRGYRGGREGGREGRIWDRGGREDVRGGYGGAAEQRLRYGVCHPLQPHRHPSSVAIMDELVDPNGSEMLQRKQNAAHYDNGGVEVVEPELCDSSTLHSGSLPSIFDLSSAYDPSQHPFTSADEMYASDAYVSPVPVSVDRAWCSLLQH